MTTFYLVRHGQSEGNIVDCFVGQGNVPLTELGKKQAEMAGNYLLSVHFDAAYASDLIRAYDTGVAALGGREMQIIVNRNLREICGGDWENLSYDEIDRLYGEEYSVWRNDIGVAHPTNGEKVSALYDRVNSEIIRLAKVHDGQTVLIATHATPIRCIVARGKGVAVENLREIPWTPNASITVLEVEGDEYTLIRDGIVEHLGDMVTRLPKNV